MELINLTNIELKYDIFSRFSQFKEKRNTFYNNVNIITTINFVGNLNINK